jgi:hypothetical protein
VIRHQANILKAGCLFDSLKSLGIELYGALNLPHQDIWWIARRKLARLFVALALCQAKIAPFM